MKYLVFFALLTFFISPQAFAQSTDDTRVQILKAQVEGFLENQKALAVKNGCRLDTMGDVTVEKAGGYYALTLPNMTYTDSMGVRSELGMIAANAVPAGNQDWKISLALPTQISSFDKTGKELFKTSVGTQNASGMWNERLGHFTSMNATYGNVQLHNLEHQGTTTIGNVSFTSNLTEKDPGAYTGTAKATLDNISHFDAGTNVKGVLPRIALNTNLADRAGKEPMTKDQIKNRVQSGQLDFYNVFSFLFGAPEKVVASVTGLDALNGQLQQSLLTAPPQSRQNLFAAVAGVSAVGAMGKPGNDPSTKIYEIMFGPDGKISLNGTDFGNMVPAGQLAGSHKPK